MIKLKTNNPTLWEELADGSLRLIKNPHPDVEVLIIPVTLGKSMLQSRVILRWRNTETGQTIDWRCGGGGREGKNHRAKHGNTLALSTALSHGHLYAKREEMLLKVGVDLGYKILETRYGKGWGPDSYEPRN